MIFVKLNNAPMIRQNQHCGTVFFLAGDGFGTFYCGSVLLGFL